MEIRAELVIDAPAEDAWVVVGERFGHISEWASAITESVMDGPPSPFGHQVRRWRAIRRMSQLDLAAAAGTTPRHLSFVETGRSWPGKDLVLRIADALTVPQPERNTLLAAAGLGPGLSRTRTRFVRHGTGQPGAGEMPRGHEPYPAWVIRVPLTIVRANAGAEALSPG